MMVKGNLLEPLTDIKHMIFLKLTSVINEYDTNHI